MKAGESRGRKRPSVPHWSGCSELSWLSPSLRARLSASPALRIARGKLRRGRVDVAPAPRSGLSSPPDLIQRTHISTWRRRLSSCLVIIARRREECAAFALLVGKHFGVEFGNEICTCFQCLAGALLGELSEEFAALRIACLDEFDRLALDVWEFFGPASL
jgi:hypothetical protein